MVNAIVGEILSRLSGMRLKKPEANLYFILYKAMSLLIKSSHGETAKDRV